MACGSPSFRYTNLSAVAGFRGGHSLPIPLPLSGRGIPSESPVSMQKYLPHPQVRDRDWVMEEDLCVTLRYQETVCPGPGA